MRNSGEKRRIAARNTAIYTHYRVLEGKKLRSDFIVSQLSQQFFLSERWIWRIIREQNKHTARATALPTGQQQPA